MTNTKITRKKILISLCLGILMAGNAFAQQYPNRPIRLVVPYAAGGSIDLIARPIAQELGSMLGYQIVIDNRGGAGGMVGSDIVAKSDPDGHTLLMGNVGPIAISPSLRSKMPYDPQKDFAPISQLTTLPFLLVVHPKLPVKNMKDLVALAKAQPGKINFASSGTGSGLHLAGEMFKHMAGVNIVHVPYKGFARALPEMLSGQVQMIFNTVPAMLPHIRAGKLRAIVYTAQTRSELLPDVPTAIESGFPDFDAGSWHGMLAPAGTATRNINKLQGMLVKIISTPDMKQMLQGSGARPVGSTPDEFKAFIAREIRKWEVIVRASGVTAN